ncbi:MAG: 4Fe-4S binding protein [Bacteroidales bacterium]|jgi:NADH:ubiquinone oxidoreductase subunit F (NADH-binding)/Pyruvate/2-oxoacid:ferredoxin oxidoreductase delta subunit/(2Fe-2S) ferredoxin|nr:4Fe-4S binding protein [Bacteroidales bacterium]
MSAPNTQQIKDFLVEKIVKNYSGFFDKGTADLLAQIKREKISHPVVYIGMGTCGLIAGSDKTFRAAEKYFEENKVDAELVKVGCLGLCSAEPLMDVQLPGKTRISFQHVTEEKVEDLLNAVFHHTVMSENAIGQYRFHSHEEWPGLGYIEQLPFFALQRRNVLRNTGNISPFNINDYLANGGYRSLFKTVLNYTAEKVCEIIDQSELRGRGGGGYPTGKKWSVALNTGSDQKYLICNADESDPGAFMDRTLLEGDPHRVIEGIAIAAYAIGANKAYIYLRSEYKQSLSILQNALQQAKEYGFLGENIFGSGVNLNILIHQGAGAFICGEETALIASLEGGRGIPHEKPPYPAEKGLFGHPTIVNNVETLANIPAILENGPLWFKSIGKKGSTGTKVFSLTGKGVNSGTIEIPMGIKISDIVNSIAGGVKDGKKLKAVQLGGPSGVCIPLKDMETEIGFDSLQVIGASLGLGGLIILDEDTCMVNLCRYFMEFLQKESCGKCIPCREGTKRMLEILDSTIRRPKEEGSHDTLERFKGVVQLETLAEVIRDTSLCGLGQNAPNPVLSSLKWFREEYEEHIFDRKCQAGVCHDLRTYFIDPELCTGCNVCQKKCPENAIIGSVKMPHFIIESKCTGCGICFDSCKFSAIYFK